MQFCWNYAHNACIPLGSTQRPLSAWPSSFNLSIFTIFATCKNGETFDEQKLINFLFLQMQCRIALSQ
jgi:hypothetical protein